MLPEHISTQIRFFFSLSSIGSLKTVYFLYAAADFIFVFYNHMFPIFSNNYITEISK